MKIGILQFPGGHGDAELKYILDSRFDAEVSLIWYKDEKVFDGDLIFIGGGFPCNNPDIDCGCLSDSPALKALKLFAENGGRVIGFANGFRLLCEADLLPGLLEMNQSGKFICRQVFITPENTNSEITRILNKEESFRIPLATYFGKYVASDEDLVQMRYAEQIVFRFCDYEGRITESVNFTGSTDNIAGICNQEKNVFGLIPQPERAVIDYLGDADGRRILDGMLEGLK